jgi:hypothetical protein
VTQEALVRHLFFKKQAISLTEKNKKRKTNEAVCAQGYTSRNRLPPLPLSLLQFGIPETCLLTGLFCYKRGRSVVLHAVPLTVSGWSTGMKIRFSLWGANGERRYSILFITQRFPGRSTWYSWHGLSSPLRSWRYQPKHIRATSHVYSSTSFLFLSRSPALHVQ